MENQTCAAHGLLTENVTHLRDSIGDLYGLIRKMTDETGEANVRIASLEIHQQTGFETIGRRLDEYEAQQINFNNKIISAIESQKHQQRPKWRPAHIVALISAIIGPSGIAAFFFLSNTAQPK